MRLGIGSYTYVWSVGVEGYPLPPNPMTAQDLLDAAAAVEAHVVQIADNLPLDRHSPDDRDALRREAARRNLRLEVGTRTIALPHLRNYLRICRELHSPILRVVVDPETPGRTARPLLSSEEIVRSLREVAPEFERAGVRLAVENHDRFPALILRDMIERVGSSHVGICFDTANSIGCLESAAHVLEILGSRVFNVHLKDYRVRRAPHHKGFIVEGAPLGQGDLDVPDILRRLRELQYSESVIVELWPPPQATIDESVQLEHQWARDSVRFLREALSGLSSK